MITANLGDSRAILINRNENNWGFHNLTNDHSPNLKEEKQRILNAGGKVEKLKDPIAGYIGPYRVWEKNLL
ncbi:MAG: hypothetical protein ACK56F_03970 [bacterium]